MRHIRLYEDYNKRSKYDEFSNKSGEDFWGDVGAGILPVCTSTGRALVAYRSEYVNEPNTYGIWGGKLDDGETDPVEAAKRELVEESGYNGKFEIVPAYVFNSPGGGFTYHNFIGVVDHEFKPTFDWETQSAKWVTYAELIRIKPKHFGLQLLIDNSSDIIKKYME